MNLLEALGKQKFAFGVEVSNFETANIIKNTQDAIATLRRDSDGRVTLRAGAVVQLTHQQITYKFTFDESLTIPRMYLDQGVAELTARFKNFIKDKFVELTLAIEYNKTHTITLTEEGETT